MAFDARDFLAGVDAAIAERKQRALQAVAVFSEAVIGRAQELAPVSSSVKWIPGVRKKRIKNPLWTGHAGTLKASGTTLDPELIDGVIVQTIGFNTNYAAAVHEVLYAYHPQGQAKFLETAMRELQPHFITFIEGSMR